MNDSVQERLNQALRTYTQEATRFALMESSVQYSLLDGGKRIRPRLMLTVMELLGGDVETAMPYACALEMIHCYSLIHDDLPAMDDDTERRGKPCNHIRFGEANAILAGDALLTRAALVLSEQEGDPRAKTAVLAAALDMVRGQSLDLNETEVDRDTLKTIHSYKTGALFVAATTVPTLLLGKTEQEEPMRQLGEKIGLLFQITDDILDAKQDALTHKPSYVTLWDEQTAKAEAKRVAKETLSLLAPYQNRAADELRALVEKMTERTN